MTVRELSRDQLDELKWDYLCSDEYDDRIRTAEGLPVIFAGDIPDKVMFEVFGGIHFVNDDFCCTMGEA